MTRPHPTSPTSPSRAAQRLSVRLAVVIVAAGAALVAGCPTPAGEASALEPRPHTAHAVADSTSWVIKGAGFGHGRGLSQWGAQGAASAGLTAAQILDFYYPGTSQGLWRGPLRVLLSTNPSPELTVTAQPGLHVRDLSDRTTWALPPTVPGARWRLVREATGTTVQTTAPGQPWTTWQVPGRGKLSGDAEFFTAAPAGPLSLVAPAGTSSYRGRLRTTLSSTGSAVTINAVSMENYVRGVVARESPAYWLPSALQAQAVAARTYAAASAVRARAAGRTYDICDTTACQVYGGQDAEEPSTDAAVAATSDVIRTWQGDPILAEFSASNGGERVGGTALPYQVYGDDPYDPTSANPVRSWSVAVTPARLAALFPAAGDVLSVTVTGRDGHGPWGGRAQSIEIVGTRSTVHVSGELFRSRLQMRSTLFTVAAPARAARRQHGRTAPAGSGQ